MDLNPPTFMLKVIWLTHFILTSWAMLSTLISTSAYLYTHLGVLAFGFWAIVSNESVDAILMFLATLAASIFNDVLILSLYEPRGYDRYERPVDVSASYRNEYRFALGMCITNLILKPVSVFILYRIYQSRVSGSEFNTGIPGFDAPRFGGIRGGYDNIETAGDTNVYGRPSEPPLYHPPAYQEPPPMGPTETSKTDH